MHAHGCTRDPALLEDLALSGAFPDIAWQREQAPGTKKAAAAAAQRKGTRSKKKLNTLSFPLHAPSTTIRQALFPTGPGSYPSPTMALQHPPEFDRQHYKFHTGYDDESTWVGAANEQQQQQCADNKRRETSWNTSFPAEYARGNLHQDFQQTLAYQEQLNRQRNRGESQGIAGNAKPTGMPQFGQAEASTAVGGDRRSRAPVSEEPDCSGANSQSAERLALLKEVAMREGLLAKLTKLVNSAAQDQDFGTERGNELLHLLLQLRDASVQVMQAVANWHTSLRTGPCTLVLDGKNYVFKMVSDLNFLAKTKSLGKILGVNPARMKRNPFMMPAPIPERDFHFIQSLPWSRTQRQFPSDPVERVATAEKYLVWCLYHLGDPVAASVEATSPPRHSNHVERDAGTWQQRAEKQLQMLSMPLEAPTDRQTHIMDSSRMMKRKGYLPSLSLSPAKTLTDLVDTVHDGGGNAQPTIVRRLNAAMSLQASWDGVVYSTSSGALEELGWMETPPHHMVTLVAASVLILLSPSDRIPKDLSWASCRKMLLSGSKLVDRMDRLEVASVPPFKLKALIPFLQNDHFQPRVLCELSRPAGVLCAWVLASLAKAQEQEVMTSRSDEDRLDLLGELEVEEGFEESQAAAAMPPEWAEDATSRPKTPKRVTIGNAEVLFINESQPVTSLSPRPASRPASRGEAPLSKKQSSVLLRTSPWTFRGVTYFVSFFLETAEVALSIKLYEPMSSVESQIFVSEEDLAADFGAKALECFQARDFRSLCDLILSRLDGMLTSSKLSGREQQITGRTRDPVVEETIPLSNDLPMRGAAIDLLEMEGGGRNDERDEHENSRREQEGEAAESIEDVVEESVLRIQCAARQRMARDKVAYVRSERERMRDTSAVKIQSVARQKLAKSEVARMRVENRRGTGIPSRDLVLRGRMKEVEFGGGAIDGDDLNLVEQEEEEEEEEDEGNEGVAAEDGEQEAPAALPPPAGHFGTNDKAAVEKGSERPETVMSYASDQFEDEDVENE